MSYDRSNPYERDQARSRAGDHPDSQDQDVADDLELGEAVGRALRERSGTVWELPPVSRIEERAAARARARAARGALAGLAAAAVLIVGGVMAWNMLEGDGTGTVVVSPDDPDAADPDSTGLDTAAADGTGSTASSTSEDGEALEPRTGAATGPATVSSPPSVEDDEPALPEEPTPEELSTGPVLQWIEIDPGISPLGRIESVGDGRIVARAWSDPGTAEDTYVPVTIVVTTNGTDWTEVPMPAEVVADVFDISGDRWLVAGPEAGADPFDQTSGRAFYSDDEGASWTELALDLPPDPAPVSPYVIEESRVTSALVSGENMVLVVSSGRHLDLSALLEGRGLVPEGKVVVGWQSSHDGSIELDLVDGPEPGTTADEAAAFEYTYGSDPVESLSLTYDELGMTAEERDLFEDPGLGQVLVYSSDGSTVELVATHEGWAWPGVASDEGFVLKVGPQDTILTSIDGRSWNEEPFLGGGYSPWVSGPGGAIWQLNSDRLQALSVQRAGFAEAFTTVATFEGLAPTGGLAGGSAGLIATATPTPDGMGDLHVGIPEGRVTKDGYELRYNEPEFGITLWDLEADTAVYVFGPEDMRSDEPPEGVREISDDDGFTVVFEDPETGADLVTFTYEDLAPVFEPEGDGSTAPLTPEAYEPPEMWVGWSADGTAWGWQLLNEAFGIDDGESWAEFAVGADFVLARVQTIEVARVLGSAGGQGGPTVTEGSESSGSASGGVSASFAGGGSGEPQPPRWFIGRAP